MQIINDTLMINRLLKRGGGAAPAQTYNDLIVAEAPTVRWTLDWDSRTATGYNDTGATKELTQSGVGFDSNIIGKGGAALMQSARFESASNGLRHVNGGEYGITPSTGYTVICWMRRFGPLVQNRPAITVAGAADRLFIALNNNATTSEHDIFFRLNNATWVTMPLKYDQPLNKNQMWVGKYDGTDQYEFRVYEEGSGLVHQQAVTNATGSYNSAQETVLGYYEGGGAFSSNNREYDDVMLFDHHISDADLLAIFNARQTFQARWEGDGGGEKVNLNLLPMVSGDVVDVWVEFNRDDQTGNSYIYCENSGTPGTYVEFNRSTKVITFGGMSSVTINGTSVTSGSTLSDAICTPGVYNRVVMTTNTTHTAATLGHAVTTALNHRGSFKDLRITRAGSGGTTHWALDSGSTTTEAPVSGPDGNITFINTGTQDWVSRYYVEAAQA